MNQIDNPVHGQKSVNQRPSYSVRFLSISLVLMFVNGGLIGLVTHRKHHNGSLSTIIGAWASLTLLFLGLPLLCLLGHFLLLAQCPQRTAARQLVFVLPVLLLAVGVALVQLSGKAHVDSLGRLPSGGPY